jgi:hypothetical protein
MQASSHTFTYLSTRSPSTVRHLSYRDTSLLIPSLYQMAAWLFSQSMQYPTCTNFMVLLLQMFGDNFVHNCTRHFLTLFIKYANCEMSIFCKMFIFCVGCMRKRSLFSEQPKYFGLMGYKIIQPGSVLSPSRLWYENLPN